MNVCLWPKVGKITEINTVACYVCSRSHYLIMNHNMQTLPTVKRLTYFENDLVTNLQVFLSSLDCAKYSKQKDLLNKNFVI